MHKINRWVLCALTVAFASIAQAQGCNDRLVVFGDSLTDPGNAFVILGVISTAPFSPIPSAPYASGTFSNGPIWAQAATALRRDARPWWWAEYPPRTIA